MRLLKWMFLMLVALAIAVPAVAQGGCVNSPENPTALLAVVGSAGGVVMALRSRFAGKKQGRK
jgi:XrtJ-associated TM-motif-TM protein